MRDAFDGVCSEVLSATSETAPNPIYDAVLIDEAQDMPSPFFRMVYKFTRPPKRIIWAYDELQKISEAGMPSLEDLFGQDKDGQPVVYLTNSPDHPQQDVILPVCYRNPPWALTVAHGLGFGTQRPEGLGAWVTTFFRVMTT
jgi:superfamily I DNA and RNA helicase